QAARQGQDPRGPARQPWTTSGDHRGEDRDAAHRLVLGGTVPFDSLLGERPRPGEAGPGWAGGEETRLGRLSRRLWDELLQSEGSA
ncbi:MAG: hypothetical protein ACRDZY_08460, partial [Acidimicrobiales bacterium]